MLHGRSDSLGQLAIIAARSLRLLLAAWKPYSLESVGGSGRPPLPRLPLALFPFSPAVSASSLVAGLYLTSLFFLFLSLSLFSRGCVVPRFLRMCLLRLCGFSASVSVVCLWCLGSGFYLALFCALCDDFGPFWGAVVFPLSLSLLPFLLLSLSLLVFLCSSLSAYVSWLVLPASCMHAVNLDQILAWIALCFCSVSRSLGFLGSWLFVDAVMASSTAVVMP